MSHATYTQGNWVDSWLLMVGSQIANLTPNLFFGHNLCFRCPNGSCKPSLNIYISIVFQWYKELFNPLGFDPCNRFLNIQKSTRTPTPKVEAPLGMWGFILSHFPTLLGVCGVTHGFLLGPQPCKPLLWSQTQGYGCDIHFEIELQNHDNMELKSHLSFYVYWSLFVHLTFIFFCNVEHWTMK